MLKRNLDNLKKFLTIRVEKELVRGFVYTFDNKDQNIRTDLLIERIKLSIQDKQKEFISHTWTDQWYIYIRMANDDVSFLLTLSLNRYNKIDSVYILEYPWHYIQNTDLLN